MNHVKKCIYIFLSIASAKGLFADNSLVTQNQNLALYRSASANMTAEMLMSSCGGCDKDGMRFDFAVQPFYTKNFNQHKKTTDADFNPGTHWSWAADGTNTMNMAADYVHDFNWDAASMQNVTATSMTLDPKISTWGMHIMAAWFQSNNSTGLFAKVQAPFGVTYLNPNFTIADDEGDIVANYFNGTASGNSNDLTKAPTYGLINGKQNSKVKLAEINAALGYYFIKDENKEFAIALRGAFATGNQPDGKLVLQPIFGNGKYHTVGAEFLGKVKIWQGDKDQYAFMQMDANLQHLFINKKGVRTFDFKDVTGVTLKGSRYYTIQDSAGTPTIYQPLANVSTLKVKSNFSAQLDIAMQFGYVTGGFKVGLGYELFARTAETLALNDDFTQAWYRQNWLATDADSFKGEITTADLDIQGQAQPGMATSKVFANMDYTWHDNAHCPHIGMNANLELSHAANNGLPLWGVAMVGGLSF